MLTVLKPSTLCCVQPLSSLAVDTALCQHDQATAAAAAAALTTRLDPGNVVLVLMQHNAVPVPVPVWCPVLALCKSCAVQHTCVLTICACLRLYAGPAADRGPFQVSGSRQHSHYTRQATQLQRGAPAYQGQVCVEVCAFWSSLSILVQSVHSGQIRLLPSVLKPSSGHNRTVSHPSCIVLC